MHPNFWNQNGLHSEHCIALLENPHHDGYLGYFFGFETFMVFKTHPLQDIASCKAWDKLVELEKMKNIVMIKIVEVMSNYEKNYYRRLRTV